MRYLSKQWFFLTLCVIGAFAILSSTMSKNPVLNPYAESLGTPTAFMGIVAAASTLPGVLVSFPAGSLSDVLGRRKVLVISTLVFASAPFFYVLVTVWWHLVLVRFYHGFATAIFIPVARATIADVYPHQTGEHIATFTSATIVGRGIAPFLGGYILSVTFWNYAMLYAVVGLAGVTAFLITFFVYPLRHEGNPSASPSDNDLTSPPDSPEGVSDWKAVLKHSGILIASLTEAAARYVYGALEFFFIGYLNTVVQLDPALIGIIMGVQFVLIPIVSPVLGRLSDQIGRVTPIIGGLLLSGGVILLIPIFTEFTMLVVISLMYGLGFVLVISSTPALVTDLTLQSTHGASMGFLAMIMDTGQMLGPIVTGFILSAIGYTGSFWSLSGILLAIAFIFGMYKKYRPKAI
jgi:MFS family permease